MRHLKDFEYIEEIARTGSIRKAASDLNITSSALNKRVQAFEYEFGTPIFERLPRGVRLNAAGEVLLQHIRGQAADFERVRMLVADMAGIHHGHVTVACSQALLQLFLPAQISKFRQNHPGVRFTVRTRDRAAAEQDLLTFSCDLACVFEPVYLADFEMLAMIEQPICAMMASTHPLAQRNEILHLEDCLSFPHVIPTDGLGVRHLLELATRHTNQRLMPVVEAESFEFMRRYVLLEDVIGFQIRIGLKNKADSKWQVRGISSKDIPPGHVFFGKLKDRELPIAAQRFAEHLAAELHMEASRVP